jgi:hypothetical protein
MVINQRATPARQVARARLSLGRWLGSLIGITAVARSGVAVMTFFVVGPLSGVVALPLWAVFGSGPIVVEWLLSGLLVVAGIIAAARVKSPWAHRRAQTAGWFIVIDTVVYIASIGVVLMAQSEDAQDPWSRFLAAVMIANAALIATAVVVIGKARSIPRIQHDLLRWHYVRKPRLARTGVAP